MVNSTFKLFCSRVLSNRMKSIDQKNFTKFSVKIVCGSVVPSSPQIRLYVIIFPEPSGYFLHFTVTKQAAFQLAILALLCEVISRADKRAARGGSKGTNYPQCLDGWQHGQQHWAKL